MPVLEESNDLTTLPVAKQYIGAAVNQGEDDDLLAKMIRQVSDLAERYCGRKFKSRSHVHDGTTPARAFLDGTGSPHLFLPDPPITAIDTFFYRFDDTTELVEGPDEDYVLEPFAGIVTLTGGSFTKERNSIEITYDGGFLTLEVGDVGYNAEADEEFGLAKVAQDLELSVLIQLKLLYDRRNRRSQDTTSYSTAGGTFTFKGFPVADETRMIWDSYKIRTLGP